MQVGLIQSAGLPRTKTWLPPARNSANRQPSHLNCITCSSLGLQYTHQSRRFWNCQPPQRHEPIPKMNLFLYIDTFYLFCLSEEPWPMQWMSPGVGLVWGTPQKMDIFVTNLLDTWSFRLCTFVTLREQDYIFKWLKRKSWYTLQSGSSGLNSTTATSWLCALEHISLNLIFPRCKMDP